MLFHIFPNSPSSSVSLPLTFHHTSFVLHQFETFQIFNTVSLISADILSTPSVSSTPHLSLQPTHPPGSLLTRSSGCTRPHLHSSGESWSCRRACPCSCCECCVLCFRWARCQTGKVARTHWASETVLEKRFKKQFSKTTGRETNIYFILKFGSNLAAVRKLTSYFEEFEDLL